MRATLCMTLVLAGCAEGPLWEKTDTAVTSALNGLHGTSATDVWAVGDDGVVLRFDGKTWSKVPSGTSNTLNAVWAASATDVWVAGGAKTVLRWNGSTFQPVPNAPESFDAVLGVSANELYFCSSSGLYLFDGVFKEYTRQGVSLTCRGLFPLEGGVGALLERSGEREVHRVSNTVTTLLATAGSSYSSGTMVALSASDLWLLESSAKSVLRYGSGMARELVLPTDTSLTTGFVRSATDVWLGGHRGRLAHYDGTELTLKVAGDYSAPTINAIWGVPGVTFAVGTRGWAMRLVEMP